MGIKVPDYQDPAQNKHNSKRRKGTLQLVAAILQTTGCALDEFSFTPFRDLQVFDVHNFSQFMGPHHSFGNFLLLPFSIIAVIPVIAKLFNKNEVNHLDDFVKQFKKETGEEIKLDDESTREKLEKIFNAQLKKRGVDYFLEAKILPDKKGKYDLKFRYKPNSLLKKLFVEEWDQNKNKKFSELSAELLPELFRITWNKSQIDLSDSLALLLDKLDIQHSFSEISNTDQETPELLRVLDALSKKMTQEPENFKKAIEEVKECNPDFDQKNNFCERLLAFNKISPAFYDKEKQIFNDNTFEENRRNALERLNNPSILSNGYALANNYSFAFWLAFFPVDMTYDQADTSLWPQHSQTGVLLAALGWIVVNSAFSLGAYIKSKFQQPDLNNPIQANKYTDKTLKHQLLEELHIQKIYEQRLKSIEPITLLENEKQTVKKLLTTASYEELKKFDCLENKEIRDEAFLHQVASTQKRIDKKNTVFKTAAQFDLLEEEANTDFGKKNSFKRFFNTANSVLGKGIGFSFIGWALGVILIAAGTLTVGAILLSNPVGLAIFGAGMIIGGILAYRGIKQQKAAEASLKEQLKENAGKIDTLKMLEMQNRKLQGLVISKGKEPVKIYGSHDDRAARKLTTHKNKRWTQFKKGLNRTAVAIGRAGTGILIVRLVVIPILMMSLGALAGPVGLGIALGAAVIWTGFNLYQYHQQSKLAVAQRTLNDIDNRIELERDNQKLLLKQLGCENLLTTKNNEQQTGDLKSYAKTGDVSPDQKKPLPDLSAKGLTKWFCKKQKNSEINSSNNSKEVVTLNQEYKH